VKSIDSETNSKKNPEKTSQRPKAQTPAGNGSEGRLRDRQIDPHGSG
jgi:hypothetical protein